MTDWYDYPQYFEAAFAGDTPIEADFIEAACRKFATGKVRTMLEPGCGGGRLIVELAKRGYRTLGIDNHPRMLAYVRKRIARSRISAKAVAGDMTDFALAKPVDAAFCTFNTFRHLLTEEAARSHLRCVARALRPGGIYILGFHLLPPDASEECIERWRAKTGQTNVVITLRVLSSSRRERAEQLRVTLLAKSPTREMRTSTEFALRLYTAAQFCKLLASVPELEHCETFDFGYEIDEPRDFDNELADAVFILRKR